MYIGAAPGRVVACRVSAEAQTAPPLPTERLGRVNRPLRRRGVEALFCTVAYALFDFQHRSMRVGSSG